MKTNVRNIVACAAILAILAMSFAASVPTAHAEAGGNHFKVELSFSGCCVVATVMLYVHQPFVQNVLFVASISFSGTSHTNINKQGIPIYSGGIIAPVWGGTATAIFSGAGQGQGYYLVTVDAYDAATGQYLGTAWTDPQGTAG